MAAGPDQPVGDAVGVIEGEAIAVSGPMTVEAVRGQVKTVLRSGADVRVRSGSARIDLIEGGTVTICGPAHLSVLKSGGALTIALDQGSVHFYVERDPALTVYTAQIKAQPVAIGDSAQNALVGFDAAGAMCVRTERGAMRLEQQLTGESVLVPQGADVLVNNGQLDSLRMTTAHCSCELRLAKVAAPAGRRNRTAEDGEESSGSKPPQSPAEETKDEPIYQVFVPPLRYDAKAKVQPEVDPAMIVLVRRVRVRPTLIFQGRVEGESVAALTTPGPVRPVIPGVEEKKPSATNDSLMDRVRNFVRKLWNSRS